MFTLLDARGAIYSALIEMRAANEKMLKEAGVGIIDLNAITNLEKTLAVLRGAWTKPTEKQVDEYLEGYETEGEGGGMYTPDADTLFVVKDAIAGLLGTDFSTEYLE